MRVSDVLAWMVLILLAVYGCAQLMRRLCLWATRCPDCAVCCRVAVPKGQVALAPLMRCLQSQSAWDDPSACRYTLLVLPEDCPIASTEWERLLQDTPSVLPVTADNLNEMIAMLAKDCNRKE